MVSIYTMISGNSILIQTCGTKSFLKMQKPFYTEGDQQTLLRLMHSTPLISNFQSIRTVQLVPNAATVAL
jgi:hypothetical protein